MSKNYTIEIKWAIRFTLLTLAWAIGEKAIGLHDQYIENYGMCSLLFFFPAVLFFFLAIREKKKYVYNNSMTWRQGFVSGIIMSFIIALLNPMAQYVIYKMISPHFFETIIAYKVQHKMTLENAKIFFNLKTYMIETTFMALSKGLITGALVSLILKNKKAA
ncbi:MAG: DUF4199 domain-containing protein [Flavobacterium sp.]